MAINGVIEALIRSPRVKAIKEGAGRSPRSSRTGASCSSAGLTSPCSSGDEHRSNYVIGSPGAQVSLAAIVRVDRDAARNRDPGD